MDENKNIKYLVESILQKQTKTEWSDSLVLILMFIWGMNNRDSINKINESGIGKEQGWYKQRLNHQLWIPAAGAVDSSNETVDIVQQ